MILKKIVIHGPIITSEVSFGHSIGIFEKAAQAILDFAGHCDLDCLVENVPTVGRSNTAVRIPIILFSYLYSTYSTNCRSHFAYSVHTSPAKLGTNIGTRTASNLATDSDTGTKDVFTVSTPTQEINLPRPVSNDIDLTASSRSVRSMGDLPVHRSSTKDTYNLNNNNESLQLPKPAFSDNLFHDTFSTTSANRRIKKLVAEIDNDLSLANK